MAMSPDDRRAIIGCIFISACILFAPGEFRAGGFLAVVAVLLTYRHVRLSKEEAKLAPPARAATVPAETAAAPAVEPVERAEAPEQVEPPPRVETPDEADPATGRDAAR